MNRKSEEHLFVFRDPFAFQRVYQYAPVLVDKNSLWGIQNLSKGPGARLLSFLPPSLLERTCDISPFTSF